MSSLHSISCILPSDLEAELNNTTNTNTPETIYQVGERLIQRLELRKKKFGPCSEVKRQVGLTCVALNMLACRTLRHAEQSENEALKHIIMDNALKMLGQAGELCGGSSSTCEDQNQKDSSNQDNNPDNNPEPNWFDDERQRLLVQTTTLNNCACVLRKTNDLEGALNCLQAALALETQLLELNEREGYNVLEEESSIKSLGEVASIGSLNNNFDNLNPNLNANLNANLNNLDSHSITSQTSQTSQDSKRSANSANSLGSNGGTILQAPRSNPAGTHLNLCAVLSKLKRHDEAMLHATSALSLIHSSKSPALASDGAGNKSSVRAIAHYNLGVEQESLGLLTAAEESYEAAMSVVVSVT